MSVKIKKKFSLILVFIGLGLFANTISVDASSSSPVVFATITDAFYDDLDKEGDIFDIQYNLSVTINDFTNSNSVYGYYLSIILGLEYPSGSTLWYRIDILSYKQTFNLKVIFYDSCLEGGWYTAHSYSFSTYGHEKAYYDSFDPPSAGFLGFQN
jgi:hypothetical protein